MKATRNRSLIPQGLSDLTLWPAPDERTFNDEKKAAYIRRRLAVQMYADGMTHDDIRKATSLPRQTICKLVHRCLTAGDDGKIAGFRALVPWQRLAGYERTLPIMRERGDGSAGCAGALTLLFSTFPEIEQSVRSNFFGGSGGMSRGRISYTALHGEFLDALREAKFTERDWPFNTKDCGYKSLRAYCLGLLKEETTRWFGARSGEEAVRRHGVGSGFRSVFPKLRGYGACQLDFHKVDAASVIIIETETGARLPVPVSRWHIGFLIEERYNLVLGAFAALERTPSGDSVLEVINIALRPSVGKGAVSCHLTADGKVFPLQLMPELAYQGFSVLKMDNAWSNAATGVVDNIINTVGCAINFGPVKAWWRRHPIERIFGELTQRGLQRLPSTFGSGPSDTKRSDPLGNAVKFEITIRDLLDVIHGCIREHNDDAKEGIDFAAPLQSLQHSIRTPDSGVFLQPLPLNAQNDFRLLCHVEVVTVRGNRKKNVRPHVTLGRWKYTNPMLASAYDLIDRQIVVYCDLRDVQVVHATVLATGEQLGALQAPSGRLGQHVSWRTRALINQAGLSERNHRNDTSVASNWREAKEESLRENKNLTRKRKRASKEALELAKLISEQDRLSTRDKAVDATSEKLVPPLSEPKPAASKKRRTPIFADPMDAPIYLGD
jgi:putative transposase